jgi:DNA-binding transcriptional MerR regulator
VSGRAYLSIGDVLTLLRQEFPDVTISKIRFLESQGLVDPERTPSGYRKFYEPDVERLRWVLRQQREHFLPLKVIKGRLEEVSDHGNGHSQPSPHPAATSVVDPARPTHGALSRSAPAGGQPLPGLAPSGAGAGAPGRHERREPLAAGRPPSARDQAPSPATAGTTGAAAVPERRSPPGPGGGAEPAPAGADGPVPGTGQPRASVVPPVPAEGDMTAEELVAASGGTPAMVSSLESYGLISRRTVGGVAYFGEDDLAVARAAAAFGAFGVEPRHLRLHKHAAEREAGFIEQVVLPLLKQRNPEARQRADDTVAELTKLGRELRAVLLARALRHQLGG